MVLALLNTRIVLDIVPDRLLCISNSCGSSIITFVIDRLEGLFVTL
jgi:hypothetical protein